MSLFLLYIYIYILIKLPWLEYSANTYMRHTEHWIAVSTLLGLISSAYGDPRHGRSNQQPQNAETETLPLGHQSMPHVSDAKSISDGKNVHSHDVMSLESTFFRTVDTVTSWATSSQVDIMHSHTF